MATEIEKLEVLEFCNERDMFEQLDGILGSVEALQDFFGIEFPFEDGTYESDGPPDDCIDEDDWESQDTSYDQHRPYGEGIIGFPKSYPARLFFIELSPSSNNTLIHCRWADDLEDSV